MYRKEIEDIHTKLVMIFFGSYFERTNTFCLMIPSGVLASCYIRIYLCFNGIFSFSMVYIFPTSESHLIVIRFSLCCFHQIQY